MGVILSLLSTLLVDIGYFIGWLNDEIVNIDIIVRSDSRAV
jgi:hypothetical protein